MTSDGKNHNKNTREICSAKGDHNRSDSWGRQHVGHVGHMWRGPRGCPHLGVGSGKWSVCAAVPGQLLINDDEAPSESPSVRHKNARAQSRLTP